MEKAEEYHISPSRIHIDPLVEMLWTSEDGIAMNVEVISTIRKTVSFHTHHGSYQQYFLSSACEKTDELLLFDTCHECRTGQCYLDPANRDMLGHIYATEALLGLDDYCMEYIGAYKKAYLYL